MKKRLRDFDLYRSYTRWRSDTVAFCCFVRATNFVSLRHYPDFELEAVSLEEDSGLYSRVEETADLYDPGKTVFLLDFPGAGLIRLGYGLHAHRALRPVITFNSPLHPYGLVGSREYISLLLEAGERLEDIEPRGYCFLMDYDRYGDYSEEDFRRFFNNQYELTDEDLPIVEMLRDLGYESLVYIYGTDIKEDAASYLAYLEEQGFAVHRHGMA